ncbi:MAG: hypothetical protein CMM25_03685 [Rhodospirillaceae bacterium]|nr:hypothetical protein [Rhodospirillaceae bacterium]|tara:strand:- start:85 stop:588 length:504 start_codon:yes stop_codon:yes gene_type:complete
MNRAICIAGDGPEKNPDSALLDTFWCNALEAKPNLPADHQVRSIGIDEETTGLILEFIKEKTKTATFSLPWVMEAEGHPRANNNTPVILLSYLGLPELVIQIGEVRETTFGDIGIDETKLDGPPVQDPNIWIPLHRDYWNGLLANYGKRCIDDMPVLIEPFELVYMP